MKTLLTTALLLLPVFGMAREKSAIICGTHEEVSQRTIMIGVQNFFGARDSNYLAFADTQTPVFRFDFPLTTASQVYLKSDKRLDLLIAPGDSLFIKFNKNGTVEFSGTNAKINREIYDFAMYKKQDGFNPVCEGKTVAAYKNELYDFVQNKIKEVNDYEATHSFSPLFDGWIRNEIIYGNANYLIHYAQYKEMKKLPVEKELMDNPLFPVDNDRALLSSAYRLHLEHYVIFKYRFFDLIPKEKADYNNFRRLQPRLDSLMRLEKAGASRDFMVMEIFNMLPGKDYTQAKKFIDHNMDKIKDKEIRELYVSQLKPPETTDRQITFLGQENEELKIIGDLFKDMAERFSGKVIFVDFWATWCGPCIAQMPHSAALEKTFAGQKVAFVYVCMSSKTEDWKNSVKNLKLNENQYFLNEDQTKVFRTKFQLNGYPSYYLIDKSGKLVDKNAPRPSNEALKEKIKALMEE